jgi:hypothetical protein
MEERPSGSNAEAGLAGNRDHAAAADPLCRRPLGRRILGSSPAFSRDRRSGA